MGEEEKKSGEEKMEEKKPEEAKQGRKEPKADKPSDDKKEETKTEESKDSKESKDPPPQPPEIVLRVYMHCEGCAKKVKKCLKGFEGVEDVQTDCKTQKVVVKGEKADPLKVLDRVQRKSHRQVDLLSPIPKPPPENPIKAEEKEIAKPQEKKEEPKVITVVLKVHMHCEACAQEIKKRIQKIKGVESADPDLKSSQVVVKGAFEPQTLAEYVSKRTGKRAVIVKQEPEKKEDDKGKEGKEEKKAGEGGGGEVAAKPEAGQEETTVADLRKNEYYYHLNYPQNYHPYFAAESYTYNNPPAPQIFSDENPNACSVM